MVKRLKRGLRMVTGNNAEGAEIGLWRAQKRRDGFVAGCRRAQNGLFCAAGGVGVCLIRLVMGAEKGPRGVCSGAFCVVPLAGGPAVAGDRLRGVGPGVAACLWRCRLAVGRWLLGAGCGGPVAGVAGGGCGAGVTVGSMKNPPCGWVWGCGPYALWRVQWSMIRWRSASGMRGSWYRSSFGPRR